MRGSLRRLSCLGCQRQTELIALLQERLSEEPDDEVAQCCKSDPNPGGNQVANRLTVLSDEDMTCPIEQKKEERDANKPTDTQPARHEAPYCLTAPLCGDKTLSSYSCNILPHRLRRHWLVGTQPRRSVFGAAPPGGGVSICGAAIAASFACSAARIETVIVSKAPRFRRRKGVAFEYRWVAAPTV